MEAQTKHIIEQNWKRFIDLRAHPIKLLTATINNAKAIDDIHYYGW